MSKNQKQNAHYVDNKKFYQAMIEIGRAHV